MHFTSLYRYVVPQSRLKRCPVLPGFNTDVRIWQQQLFVWVATMAELGLNSATRWAGSNASKLVAATPISCVPHTLVTSDSGFLLPTHNPTLLCTQLNESCMQSRSTIRHATYAWIQSRSIECQKFTVLCLHLLSNPLQIYFTSQRYCILLA